MIAGHFWLKILNHSAQWYFGIFSRTVFSRTLTHTQIILTDTWTILMLMKKTCHPAMCQQSWATLEYYGTDEYSKSDFSYTENMGFVHNKKNVYGTFASLIRKAFSLSELDKGLGFCSIYVKCMFHFVGKDLRIFSNFFIVDTQQQHF